MTTVTKSKETTSASGVNILGDVAVSAWHLYKSKGVIRKTSF